MIFLTVALFVGLSQDYFAAGLSPVPWDRYPVEVFGPLLCELGSGVIEWEFESQIAWQGHQVIFII
jgi:hypothetical protein